MGTYASTLGALGLLLGAAALPTVSSAAEDEVAVQVGVTSIGTRSFDVFAANNNVMPGYGIRAGWAFHERFSLIGDLQAGQRGQRIVDATTGDELFRTAYTASTLTLGVRGDIRASNAFFPYALVAAVGHLGHARFDDDPTRRDHPGQLRSTAASFGGTVRVGAQVLFGEPDDKVRPTLNAELGWQGVLRHRYPQAGDQMLPLGYGGLAVRAGAGIAF